jgi:hypothetical protein
MSPLSYYIDFSEGDDTQVRGVFELEDPLPCRLNSQGNGFYRTGRIALEGWEDLHLVLYHSTATAAFIYMRSCQVEPYLLETIGLSSAEIAQVRGLRLPGQLCLGSERSNLIDRAIKNMFSFPGLRATITQQKQQNLAIFPIAREGLKYQVTESIYENYGYYCDEIVLDAHHVFDHKVPVYNRKVEMTLFKDKDLDKKQHENIKIAFIADSIASGLVMKEVIEKIKERFDHIQQVEIIAPLATIRGLCKVARTELGKSIRLRVHVFETLLNALPPDFYYSAHFNIPEFHIRPDLQQEYREWWGKDSYGNYIADTACAGYGWSEVFYSPRKQIKMINEQLETRHNLAIADIVRRNLNLT